MANGVMLCLVRRSRIFSASDVLTAEGFHWRGEEEKI